MADEIRPPKQLSQFGARFPDWCIMKGETSFILDSRCQASVAEGGPRGGEGARARRLFRSRRILLSRLSHPEHDLVLRPSRRKEMT
jgi:hypothetical protein